MDLQANPHVRADSFMLLSACLGGMRACCKLTRAMNELCSSSDHTTISDGESLQVEDLSLETRLKPVPGRLTPKWPLGTNTIVGAGGRHTSLRPPQQERLLRLFGTKHSERHNVQNVLAMLYYLEYFA